MLGIPGKGELDVYIPVDPGQFDSTVLQVEKLLEGAPKSLYPLDRARFITLTDGIEDEVFVVNKEGKSCGKNLIFEEYLKNNPDALNAYKNLKTNNEGLSVRAYYTAKESFINDILDKVS